MVRRPQGLTRDDRLTQASDYRRVFADNNVSSDRFFTVLAHPRSGPGARLGLAIAKKHARRAVDRNRIKRVVREGFRRNKDLLKGYDLVVLAKPQTAGQSKARLRNSLGNHWRRVADSH